MRSDIFQRLTHPLSASRISIILVLIIFLSLFPYQAVLSYDEPFTGYECACSALDSLGWHGSSEGMLLGYPRYLLRCDYSKDNDPGGYLYGPSVMTLQIQYFETNDLAVVRFLEYKKDINPEGTVVQAENTAVRASSLTRITSWYSGIRFLLRDNYIIGVTGGGLVFKSDAEFIQTFDALESCAWAILDSKKTTTKFASLTGRVEDGHDHPLEKVQVQIYWDFNDGSGFVLVGSTWTDEKGQYKLEGAKLQVPMPKGTKGFIRVYLKDKDEIIEIIDSSVNTNTIVYCDFGDVPRTTTSIQLFQINNETDLTRDLIFPIAPALAALSADMQYDPSHSDDCAITYYYTYIALNFYRKQLDVTFGPAGMCNHTPLPIYTWSANPSVFTSITWVPAGDGIAPTDFLISIEQASSAWNDSDAPKNREFHEFSHYVIQDYFEGMARRLRESVGTESKDVNLNGTIDQDSNHAGYWANHLSTTDAWEEGLAIFMGCVISDWAVTNRYSFQNDDWKPYVYPVGNAPIDLETRYIDEQDEEYAATGILWDLYDGINDKELDGVQLGIYDLWQVITDEEFFTQYWELDSWRNLLSNWTGDKYAVTTNDFPVQMRHIACIKDLYDTLVLHFSDKKSAINEIFAWHDIWVLGELYIDTDLLSGESYDPEEDIWLPAFDLDGNGRYTGPDEVATETILLPPRFIPGVTQIYEDFENIQDFNIVVQPLSGVSSVTQSHLAAYHGDWGLDIEIDSRNTSSLKIDRAFQAPGTNYFCFWLKAPAAHEFYIKLADSTGLWISPLLRGKTDWNKYYVSYSNFTKVSASGISTGAVNQTEIKNIIIDFITAGSYSVNLDYITSEAVVSEVRDELVIKGKPITILGVGSPGRAFRRNKPPPDGSFIEIISSSLLGKVRVQISYEPPYESHNFGYDIEITESPQLINVYSPGNGSLSLVQTNSKGETIGEPLLITSDEFWDNLSKENPGSLGQLNITGIRGTTWIAWPLLVLAIVLFIGCITYIFRSRGK